MIEIRPANPADVPVILHFVRELAAYEREPDAVTATDGMLQHALFGPDPAATAIIATLDGVAVGFALYFYTFSTWTGRRSLYLEDLYVAELARGSGVGTAMLRHLAAVALDSGCVRFEWSVLDWNAPAIAFYRAMGAIGMEEWTIQRVAGDALVQLAGRGDGG